LVAYVNELAPNVNDIRELALHNHFFLTQEGNGPMKAKNRRDFVKTLTTASASLASKVIPPALPMFIAACSNSGEDSVALSTYPKQAEKNLLGFVGHLQNGIEGVYEPLVIGTIPAGLNGTFYRNGPGVYTRPNGRKGTIADGDGMIRMYRFGAGKVAYRSRLVQTAKLVEEQAAGKFVYGTWTSPTPADGKVTRAGSPNQAGVTTVVRNGKLYAHDEVNPPWTLNPDTLESIATDNLRVADPTGLKAHFRVDAKTDEWVLSDTVFSPTVPSHSAYIVSPDGKSTAKRTIAVGRNVPLCYSHDFFVTASSVMFFLQPAFPDFQKLGQGVPFGKSLTWDAKQTTKLAIVSRTGDAEPIIVEIPSNWMWHSANAYDRGNEIVADYVGYEQPDHFVEIDGNEPAWYAYMNNRTGSYKYPGKLRRLVINKVTRSVKEEILDAGNNEFPVTDKRVHCYEHRNIYYIQAATGALWWSKIMRFDTTTGVADGYDFGPGYYLNEPVFAADTTAPVNLAKADLGWVLVPVFELATGVSSLAVFRADALGDGPIASVRLRTHDSFAFHGSWQPS
jgi:all-trans-8'-apo-beta-carotenal 15,15'-oxygenase